VTPSEHSRYANKLADRLDERSAASLARDSLRMDIIRTMTAQQYADLQERWQAEQRASVKFVPIDDLIDRLVVKP